MNEIIVEAQKKIKDLGKLFWKIKALERLSFNIVESLESLIHSEREDSIDISDSWCDVASEAEFADFVLRAIGEIKIRLADRAARHLKDRVLKRLNPAEIKALGLQNEVGHSHDASCDQRQ